MHRALFTTALLLTMALGMKEGYAAANVLLPPKSAQPDFGLIPGAQSKKPAQETDYEMPKVAEEKAEEKKDGKNEPESPPSKPAGKQTTILNQKDNTAFQNDPKLPHALTLSFGENSAFGDKDYDAIEKKIGYSKEQVKSLCTLSLRGLITTDKRSYPVGGGLSKEPVVTYDGKLQSHVLQAQALCKAEGEPPQTGGTIAQIEDRYVVPLQQIKCSTAIPDKVFTSLILTYNGDFGAVCEYP